MNKNYYKQTHLYGRLWMISALLLFIAVPITISVSLDAWPTFGEFLKGYLPILSLFGPIAIIEILTYSPMLGVGGTYLGFITGNLSNLKVPCAINAMQNSEVTPGSDEAEVVSTIAVGTSAMVTIIILFFGVVGFSQIMPILNSETLAPAFANLLPSLFGGLAVVFIAKNVKIAVVPIVVALALFVIYPGIPVSILIPVEAIISISVAWYLYKKGKI